MSLLFLASMGVVAILLGIASQLPRSSAGYAAILALGIIAGAVVVSFIRGDEGGPILLVGGARQAPAGDGPVCPGSRARVPGQEQGGPVRGLSAVRQRRRRARPQCPPRRMGWRPGAGDGLRLLRHPNDVGDLPAQGLAPVLGGGP